MGIHHLRDEPDTTDTAWEVSFDARASNRAHQSSVKGRSRSDKPGVSQRTPCNLSEPHEPDQRHRQPLSVFSIGIWPGWPEALTNISGTPFKFVSESMLVKDAGNVGIFNVSVDKVVRRLIDNRRGIRQRD
jgi:hypothetical protein